MLDNTIYMGVNAPKPHQRVIGKLMMNLGIKFYKEKRIPFEPFPKTMIDETQTSPAPNILLFDNDSKMNKLIIEVAGNAGAKKDFEKVKQLVLDYEVPEGFVYNYQGNKWMKYSLERGEETQTRSYSDLLQIDLNELLE